MRILIKLDPTKMTNLNKDFDVDNDLPTMHMPKIASGYPTENVKTDI